MLSVLCTRSSQEGYGLLVMDASNAFNSISRAAAIWNTRIYWSRCSRYVFNSYRGYAVLFIAGSQVTLLSKEGVTQGDPLAILVYGIGILPLQESSNIQKNGNKIGMLMIQRALQNYCF